MSRIELPGQPAIELKPPSPAEEAIFRQLQQMTVSLNTIAGQLDMLIRIECGNVQKKDVNARLKAHDHAIATTKEQVDAKSNSNAEDETDATVQQGS